MHQPSVPDQHVPLFAKETSRGRAPAGDFRLDRGRHEAFGIFRPMTYSGGHTAAFLPREGTPHLLAPHDRPPMRPRHVFRRPGRWIDVIQRDPDRGAPAVDEWRVLTFS